MDPNFPNIPFIPEKYIPKKWRYMQIKFSPKLLATFASLLAPSGFNVPQWELT